MQLKVTKTNFNYDNKQDTHEVTGVAVLFNISELFQDTNSTTKSCTLNILYSEYLSNVSPSLLVALVKNKVHDRISSGELPIQLTGIDYSYDGAGAISSVELRFTTKDMDNKNKISMDDKVSVTLEEFNTALSSQVEGFIGLIKEKLLAEFV